MIADTIPDAVTTTATTVAATAAPAGGFEITPLQAVAGLIVALIAVIYAANKYVFEKYLPRKQENEAAERTAERKHEQSLVSKLTDQSADLQSKLFEVVTQRLGGIEQTSQIAASEVGKLVGQIESLASQVRTTQLEVRELRGQLSGAALGSETVEVPMPPPNPRPTKFPDSDDD